jgi:hypothetical protein
MAMLPYATVLPTKDRPHQACAVVEAALEQTRPPEQIIVVDASATPLTIPDRLGERVRAAGIGLVVVHSEPSTARQRNLGVDRVQTPLVLFLDDDVHLEPQYAEELLVSWDRAGLTSRGGMVGSPEFVPTHSRAGRFARQAFMLHYHAPRGSGTTFRRSRKLRFVARPPADVSIPAVGAGGAMFRTDLLRKHRFDERFPGYALGEDIEMSRRLARDSPIIQTPAVRFLHDWDPRERQSRMRWHHRGRRETYFRLRHLERSPLSCAAFGLSLLAEAAAAALDSIRERDLHHVRGFATGVVRTLLEEPRRRG